MGRAQRNGRDVHGILLLNKPLEISSNLALQKVKRLFNARKAGHTGSLDPLATGMLPICFGEATKFSQFLLDADKIYQVTAKLGIKTASGDRDGEILGVCQDISITRQQFDDVLVGFRGEQQQVPPMYSALKHQGRPLYELARQGIEIERAARTVQIRRLVITDWRETEVDLEVSCSKGTYIRSLIDDIGDVLGCGAHVSRLHRLRAGAYPETKMLSWEALQACHEQQGFTGLDALLLPLETAVSALPEVELSEESATYVLQGKPINVADISHKGLVRLSLAGKQFLGVADIFDDGSLKVRRLLSDKLLQQEK